MVGFILIDRLPVVVKGGDEGTEVGIGAAKELGGERIEVRGDDVEVEFCGETVSDIAWTTLLFGCTSEVELRCWKLRPFYPADQGEGEGGVQKDHGLGMQLLDRFEPRVDRSDGTFCYLS